MNTLKCSDVDQLKNAVNQGEAEGQHHRGQRSFAATAVSPFREGGEALQQLNTARILQVFQPEVERIGPGSRRELVDEGFVCVGVLHTPGCADPRRPEWGLGKAVANRPDVRKRIRNRGVLDDVAWRVSGLVRQASEARSDQRHVARGAFGNEELRLPGNHIAVPIEDGAQIDQRWRALWIPAMLVGAHPLHADWPTDSAGQQRRIAGRVFVPVATVTAGALDIDAAHTLDRQVQHRRKLLFEIVRGLRGGPAGQLPVLNLGDRAGRANRGVGVDGKVVRRLQRLCPLRQRLLDVANIAGDIVLVDLGRTDVLVELLLLG